MNLAVEVPLLAGLPKVELARLVGDAEELHHPVGTTVLDGSRHQDSLYFIVEGAVEVGVRQGDNVVPLTVLKAGDLFGESALLHSPQGEESVTTLTPVRLIRLPAKRIQRLMQSEPALAGSLIQALAAKTAGTRSELARVKGMLGAYMDEVWNTIPASGLEEAVAVMPAAGESMAQGIQAAEPKKRRAPFWKSAQLWKFAGLGGSTAVSLLVFELQRGTPKVAAITSVLLWAALNWLMGTVPDYVTALVTCVMAVLAAGVAPATAFSGFASPSWFLLLGVLGIGVAVSRSGLLYRIALYMLRLLPPTYRGQSLALAITGIMFTPLLPSANSRSALASPLARELSDAMRLPALGKGTAGLAMSSFLGFGQMYFMFLNGTNICLLAWSLLPAAARQQVTWGRWLWWALPLGILTFIGCYLAILYLFRPEPTAGVSRKTITAQLRVLGPLAGAERQTAVVLGLVLLGFMTQGIHGIDPGWISLGGFLLLIALGVVDKNGLKALDWGFLLLVGCLVSLSDITKVTGLTDKMTQWISPVLRPLGASPYLFLGAVAVLMLLARLAIPIQQAVLVMVMALLPVSTQMGFHPFVLAVVVLAMSNSWILPQQNSMYLTVHSGTEERSFTHRQVRPLALVQSLVGVLAILASVPFWQYLGLVPR